MSVRAVPRACLPRDLRPGDVIDWGGRLALIVSNHYPADTVSEPEARLYCEPRLVFLKHQREDRWVWTHEATYALLPVGREVTVNTSARVQQHNRQGPFLTWEERRGQR